MSNLINKIKKLRLKKNQCYAIVFLVSLFFIGKWLFNSNPTNLETINKIVEVEIVQKNNFQQKIRLIGTIHPKHITVLTAKASGTLDELIPSGHKITKGTLIAKINNPELENNLLLSSNAETLTQSQLGRLEPLLKKGYVSNKEYEEKKQSLIDAQKALAKSKIELQELQFYAPFDGIVGAYKKREGAQVKQGDSIVSFYDPTDLVLDFDIPCSNLSPIKEGQTVYALGKKYAITHFQKMLDEDSHMCPADVDIQCSDCLIGSTVDVDLVVKEKSEAISIPFQALFLRNSKPHVYIVENGKVTLAPVKIGVQQEARIEILEGLKPKQFLITKGLERLSPDMQVDIYKPNSQTIP